MKSKRITLTADEAEDIRFCLAKVAQQNEDKTGATDGVRDLAMRHPVQRSLLEQAGRFRRLAVKVSGETEEPADLATLNRMVG